jgi:hypothetical protein
MRKVSFKNTTNSSLLLQMNNLTITSISNITKTNTLSIINNLLRLFFRDLLCIFRYAIKVAKMARQGAKTMQSNSMVSEKFIMMI